MVNRLSLRTAELIAASLIAMLAFICYCLTLCPSLNFIDSGELATVGCTLGIAHPTGYPLFSVISWLFVHLPLGMRPITQLNLMAAFLCSAGIFIFFRFCVYLIGEYFPVERTDPANRKLTVRSVTLVLLPAALGSLTLAFSETYWSQALSIEVYSLHIVFLSLLLLLFTKAVTGAGKYGAAGESVQNREGRWLLFAFVLGLAFTNHMTTILLAPAFLTWYFIVYGMSRAGLRRIGAMVIPFLAGFSVQLYLPIRAATHPVMNWGNPVDLERWFTHFSGKVYRVWIFSSTESASKQLHYFFSTIGDEFAWLPLIAAVAGLLSLAKTQRRILLVTLLLFFGCLLYSINYDIHDIDSYFLLIYFTIAIWVTVGFRFILGSIRNRSMVMYAGILLLITSAGMARWTYPRVDESSNRLVENYTKDLLSTVGPNGIVISYQWDYFVSAANYLQVVEHVRPDVAIIDKELLRRSWYFDQLDRRYPGLLMHSRAEIDIFLKELKKFEHDLPYDPPVIERAYSQLIRSIIQNSIGSRPVYVTQEIEPQYTAGYMRIPSGIPFRLYADTLLHQAPSVAFNVEVPSRKDLYRDGIIAQYVQAYTNNAIYANYSGNRKEARRYASEALALDPGNRQARIFIDQIRDQ